MIVMISFLFCIYFRIIKTILNYFEFQMLGFIHTKIFCGYQSISTFPFNLFLLISTADHIHLNIRFLFGLFVVYRWKPCFSVWSNKRGSSCCNITASPVCECVTETDICLTFYAGLNDWLGTVLGGRTEKEREEKTAFRTLNRKHISPNRLQPQWQTVTVLTGRTVLSVTRRSQQETVHPWYQTASGAWLMIQPDREAALVIVLQRTLLLIFYLLQCCDQWN